MSYPDLILYEDPEPIPAGSYGNVYCLGGVFCVDAESRASIHGHIYTTRAVALQALRRVAEGGENE